VTKGPHQRNIWAHVFQLSLSECKSADFDSWHCPPLAGDCSAAILTHACVSAACDDLPAAIASRGRQAMPRDGHAAMHAVAQNTCWLPGAHDLQTATRRLATKQASVWHTSNLCPMNASNHVSGTFLLWVTANSESSFRSTPCGPRRPRAPLPPRAPADPPRPPPAAPAGGGNACYATEWGRDSASLLST